jgi:hypothetical protein
MQTVNINAVDPSAFVQETSEDRGMDLPSDNEQRISALTILLLLELVRETDPGDNQDAVDELIDQIKDALGPGSDPTRLIARTTAGVMRMVFQQNGGDAEEILQSIVIHGSGAA